MVAIELNPTPLAKIDSPKKNALDENRKCKVSMVILTEFSATETVRDELFGLDVQEVAFDGTEKVLTLKAKLPSFPMVSATGPDSGWNQIVTKTEGPQILVRKTDMVADIVINREK